MILFLNDKNYIISYNTTRHKESVDVEKNEVWFDGEFSFFDGEVIEGKGKNFIYNNGEISIEYFDINTAESDEITEPQPTNKDIQNQLTSMEDNQYALMMAITDLYEMNL